MRSRSGFSNFRYIVFALLCTQESTLHSNEEDEAVYRFPREQRDIELREVAEGLRIGVQSGASAFRQRQNDTIEKDASFEGFDVEFLYEFNERLSAQLLVNYEFDGTKRIIFEEVFAEFEIVEDGPWYIEAGRMEMPFGEYNSNFVEDPLTETVGETFDGGLILGIERDIIELSIAGFKGDFRKTNVMASANIAFSDNLDTGFYISDNIGESLELRDIQREAMEDDEGGTLATHAVSGVGAFVAWNIEPFTVDIEFISALSKFNAGLINDDPQQPRAANIEIAYNALDRWQFAARIERSKHLPDSPKQQYGFAASYGITENFILTGNYLRGKFREDSSKRNLFQIELVFEF